MEKAGEVMMSGLLAKTSRVSFELSNRCNYADWHKACPLNRVNGPVTLPLSLIENALRFLKDEGFGGLIDFSNYNEPLIDPRLFYLTEKASRMLPQCRLRVLTNGSALDQQLLNELAETGIKLIRVSCYSDDEEKRLKALRKPAKLRRIGFMRPRLDDRINHYEREPLDLPIPCYAPLHEILVTCEGRVALCCFDWRRHITFGNLYEENLKTVLRSGKMQKVYARLSRGDRYLPLCRRCDRLLHSGRHKRIWKKRVRK